MTTTIWFDMDGTCNLFYQEKNWLEDLMAENVRPYLNAKPALNLSVLVRLLHRLQDKGFHVGIISWTAKNSSEDFHNAVIEAKMKWLHRHMPSMEWDEIFIVPYGEAKNQVNNGNDILFDDEKRHHDAWTGESYYPDQILEILRGLL